MAERLTTRWRLEIEVLSPLHIGRGGPPLLHDHDFVAERGRIWVLDPERVFARLSDEELLGGGVETRASKLLRPEEYAAHARHALALRGDAPPNEIAPLVRDADDRPYVPGSSLKGALRTALAWAMVWDLDPPLDLQRDVMRGNPQRAASGLERRLFGPDPNHDLLRALRVSDAHAASEVAVEAALLGLYGWQRGQVERRTEGTRWCVEAVTTGARFAGEVSLDSALYASGVLRGGRVRDANEQLRPLHPRDAWHYAREFAIQLAAHEQKYFQGGGLPAVERFYADLQARLASAPRDETALALGWGTGWLAKTIGLYLEHEPTFPALVREFRLDRGRGGEEFPATRRLVERGGRAEVPLGWVWLRWQTV